jgi:hypothetical protein
MAFFHMEAKELRVCDNLHYFLAEISEMIRDIGLGEIPKFEISWRLGKGTC